MPLDIGGGLGLDPFRTGRRGLADFLRAFARHGAPSARAGPKPGYGGGGVPFRPPIDPVGRAGPPNAQAARDFLVQQLVSQSLARRSRPGEMDSLYAGGDMARYFPNAGDDVYGIGDFERQQMMPAPPGVRFGPGPAMLRPGETPWGGAPSPMGPYRPLGY